MHFPVEIILGVLGFGTFTLFFIQKFKVMDIFIHLLVCCASQSSWKAAREEMPTDGQETLASAIFAFGWVVIGLLYRRLAVGIS